MKGMDNEKAKTAQIIGIIMMVIVGLFFAADAISHILLLAPVAASFVMLGLSTSLAVPLGFIVLICLVLYLFPRTSVLGAILLTGYLGGAVMVNVYASLGRIIPPGAASAKFDS
jgi:hypothetical protein